MRMLNAVVWFGWFATAEPALIGSLINKLIAELLGSLT